VEKVAMLALLDSFRDALMALALAWIGVFVEPAPQQPSQPEISGETAPTCQTNGQVGACTTARQPGFSTPDCAASQK
jgi:hypothetical protein